MPWIQIRHNITFHEISGQTTLNSLLVHTLGNSGVHLGGSSARAWSTQPENGNKHFKANWSILTCWKIVNTPSCAFLHAIVFLHNLCTSSCCTQSERKNVKLWVSADPNKCENTWISGAVCLPRLCQSPQLPKDADGRSTLWPNSWKPGPYKLTRILVKNDARKFSRLQSSSIVLCIELWSFYTRG